MRSKGRKECFLVRSLLKNVSSRNVLNLTQQDPQEPWSLISFSVGQLGHCSLESNSLGSLMFPAYRILQSKRSMISKESRDAHYQQHVKMVWWMKTQVTCAASNTTHKPRSLWWFSTPKSHQPLFSIAQPSPSPFWTMWMHLHLN